MVKILRLGLSECSLICIYWINTQLKKNNMLLDKKKQNLVKWLYTTSGFYDKRMKGHYFNQLLTLTNCGIYNSYMQQMLNIIKNCDKFEFCFHDIGHSGYVEQFKNFINPKERIIINHNIVFEFIRDKNVLFVSPFAPLYKSQIESGNCGKIYDNFPNVKKITAYKNIHTFFNNGPHNNIMETTQYIVNEISVFRDDFDCVIISCGAYSCLIADEISKWKKDVCTVGGNLQSMFGILNTRVKQHNPNILNEISNKECWIIDIPNEYKPYNYMKIENGCYW